jgi:hypothetical protein
MDGEVAKGAGALAARQPIVMAIADANEARKNVMLEYGGFAREF